MKAKLYLYEAYIILGFLFTFCGNSIAQVTYSQDFNTNDHNWELTEFGFIYPIDDDLICLGSGALGANLFTGLYDGYTAQMVSPPLGVSNGGVATMSYSYKLVDFDTHEAMENSDNWGSFHIYYSISPTGPYTLIETVNTTNHIESDICATRTVNFTPPAGEQVYVSIYGVLGSHTNDFWLIIDNVTVVQGVSVFCSGLPAASTTIASNNYICDTENILLTLSTAYTNAGLSYKWQTSADGVNFADVAVGGTSLQYNTTQTATTWYRAKISCGTDLIYSTPTEVVSNGMVCYCDVEFSEFAFPITLVNFAGINNVTSNVVNGTPGVENFTELPPVDIMAGEEYTITLKANTVVNEAFYITAYFDWNHDGDLTDANESYQIGSINSNGQDGIQLTGQIAILQNALPGITYMRVLMMYGTFPENPCSSVAGLGVGQAEDYFVNILALMPDFANIQWPPTMEVDFGESGTVYAQVYEPGITESAGQGTGISAWIGINTENTDPSTWTTWIPATYNVAANAGNNDEYMATIGSGLQGGTYYYASRFQIDGGIYAYGGVNGIWNGTTNISGLLTVNCNTEPPIAENSQTVCEGSTISDLQASGDEIIWYTIASEGFPLPESTMLADGIVYYASQMPINGCESQVRTPVTVIVTNVLPPTGDATQQFTAQASLSDIELVATGTVNYYATEEDALSGENALSAEDVIPAGSTTYYITQTIGGCESAPYAVTVDMTLGNQSFVAGSFTYYPNPVNDVLTLSYTEGISSVEVYNLIGQKVMSKEYGQNNIQLNMATLSVGTYLVKVMSGEDAKVIKVVKK